jgi:hypothetical protein
MNEVDVMLSKLRGVSLNEAYINTNIKEAHYKSNNKYANFPALMTDGRSVSASWQPSAFVDESIRKDNNIQSNWQYRRYLINNANDIRSHNFNQACNDTGYYIRNENKEIENSTNYKTPHIYKNITDPVEHVGASNSDLKELYLTKEQLHARTVVPSITQAELIQNWGVYIQGANSS